MPQNLEVYLAGPDVFYPEPIKVGQRKKEMLSTVGIIGHFPMDNCIPDFNFDEETAFKIAEANEDIMKKVQVILVNMTPWHGPSMDVGTAFEAGFMSGRAAYEPNNILIIGYYEGEYEPNFSKRVSAMIHHNEVSHSTDGAIIAKDNTSIENFKLTENLMIPNAIRKTGGDIFDSFETAVQNVERLWNEKQAKLTSPTASTDRFFQKK